MTNSLCKKDLALFFYFEKSTEFGKWYRNARSAALTSQSELSNLYSHICARLKSIITLKHNKMRYRSKNTLNFMEFQPKATTTHA